MSILSQSGGRLACGLALVLALTLGLVIAQPARAQVGPSGSVLGWGLNHVGQLDIPPDLSDVVAVAASQVHSLALKSDGTVVAWGSNVDGQTDVPAGLGNVSAIAAGGDHSMALKGDGTVVAWGSNASDQLNIPAGLNNVIAIAAGDFHSMALKGDGTVVAWGCGGGYDYDQCTVPAAASSGVVSIAAGAAHSLALKSNGAVVAWGIDLQGQTAVPASASSGVVAIAAAGGSNHSLALKSDGTLVAWGRNTDGQTDVPAGLTGVAAITTGFNHSLARKSDGTLVAWGNNVYGQTDVPAGLTGVVGMAGGWHTLVIVPAPTVTINQAAGQADPTSTTPIRFTATFSKPVTDFAGADVTLSGSAGLTNATVTISGGPSVYTISVGGVDSSGSVIATIAANSATDANGIGNRASTSTDNSVAFTPNVSPPTITPNLAGTLGANNWYVSNVTLSWSVAANGAAISSQTGCATQNITSDTSGVTFTCSATNAAGTSSQSVTVKRDATAPVISFVDRTAANSNGWNNINVVVNWSCSDATAGAVAATVSQSVSSEGASQSATGACADNAGNSATNSQSGIKIDKTAPTISSAVTTQPNANGWYRNDVTIRFTCADALSGVASCPADEVLSAEGSAIASTAQTVTDLAGNTSAPSTIVTVRLDKTAPAVAVTGFADGANFPAGGAPTPGCTTSDALSGVATAATSVVSGGNVVGTGRFIVTCRGATDSAGNSGSARATYTIDLTPGMAVFWGDTANGKNIIPADLGPVIAVSANSNYSLALKPDGTVVAWGTNDSGQTNVPADLRDVIAIDAGVEYALALKRDGTVVAWGANDSGQSSVPAGLRDVIAIAAGIRHSMALKSDGTVVAWGRNNYGQSTPPAGLSGVVAIDAGFEHSLALKSDGTVVGWGRADFDQINIPAGLTDVVAIAAGQYHSVALKRDGTVVAWGSNSRGQRNIPVGLTDVVAIATDQHVLALKRDGTVVAWGYNDRGQANVPPGTSNVIAMSAGQFHSLVIKQAVSATINQAAGQPDPAISNPVRFAVIFGEPVTGFTPSDVALSGTADRTSATVTVSGGPAAYTVTVDGLAGNGTVIASIPANVVATADGKGNFASTSTDNIVTVNLDSTPPVITASVVGTLGSNSWYTGDVSVSWSVVDGESAVSSQAGCGAQSVTSDTAGVTFTCTATSAGGSASRSVTVKRDATAPAITFASRTAANAAGWNNGAVTVSWTCSDATSGAVSASVSRTVSAEGASQSATGSCADNAGNSASNTRAGINIDRTAPTISAAAAASPNANGWYRDDVSVAFSCDDTLSGVASCPANQTLTGEGVAVSSTAQTVSDLAGNTSAPSNVVTVKIDHTAPSVSVTGVTNGATYTLGGVPAAGCSTTDALSGVATQASLTRSAGSLGLVTVTCGGATDNAGNAAAAVSVSYRVAYSFLGFFQPVDNLPTVNTANAGRTIPLKWRVVDAAGNPVTNLTSVTVTSVAGGCSAGAPADSVEEYATTNTGLLNQGNGYYQFNWQTDRGWSGCRTLRLDLGDGLLRTALFQFR